MKLTTSDIVPLLRRHARSSVPGRPAAPPRDDAFGFDRVLLIRMIAAALLFAAGVLTEDVYPAATLPLLLLSAVASGYDLLLGAAFGLAEKRWTNDELLLTLACAAAFLIRDWDGAAALLLLLRIGELLRDYLLPRVRGGVLSSLDAAPDSARVFRDAGELDVSCSDILRGDTLLIGAGEGFPADCGVEEGGSTIDPSPLCASSRRRPVRAGERVASGCVNLTSPLKCRALAPAEDSTHALALKALSFESGKSDGEETLTQAYELLTPVLAGFAALLFVALWFVFDRSFKDALEGALSVLVIACPGSLALCAATALFSGRVGAARGGALFKDSDAIETAACAKAVILDKNGALTTGEPRIISIMSPRMDAEMMLRIAAHAACRSSQPSARVIAASYSGELRPELISDYKEDSLGITVHIGELRVCLGTRSLVAGSGAEIPDDLASETAVHMSVDGGYAGRFLLGDTVRDDAGEAVLRLESYAHVAMVTSENRAVAARLAESAGINECHAACTPADMAAHVTAAKKRVGAKRSVIFAGDSAENERAMAAADLGAAMDGFMSAAAEYSDLLILDGRLSSLSLAIDAAKSTRLIIWQNLAISLGLKLLIVALSVAGASALWLAALTESAAALLVLLNSARASRIRQNS